MLKTCQEHGSPVPGLVSRLPLDVGTNLDQPLEVRMATRPLAVLGLVVAMLGGCTGATVDPVPTTSSAPASPRTLAAPDGARELPCGDAIDHRSELPEGYAGILDAVALPVAPASEQALQAVRDEEDGVPPFWSKTGLLVRAGVGVTVAVDAPAGAAALGWGHAGDPDYFRPAITTSGCDGDDWLAFPGGFRVDEPRCLDLVVTTVDAQQQVQVGVGAPCDGQQPPPF